MPHGHQLGRDLHQRRLPNGGLLHRAEHQVLHGRNDFHVGVCRVDHRKQHLHRLHLRTLDGDDDFLDVVFLHNPLNLVIRAETRKKFCQLVFRLVIHIKETDDSSARRLHLLLDLLEDGAGVIVTTHNQRVEPYLLAPDTIDDRCGDYEARDIDDNKLKGKQRYKRLVIRLVGRHFVVKDDHEEQHHHTQQGDEKRLAELLEARFVVHLLIGTRDSMKDEPTDGDDNDTQPKTRRDKRMGNTVPIVDVKVLVRLAEEIEKRPC